MIADEISSVPTIAFCSTIEVLLTYFAFEK